MNIGFIGLGGMGRPMAEHLLGAGHRLAVWARRREAAEPVLALGASWVDSPAALARQSEIVCTNVTGSADVVVLAERMLDDFAPGSIHVDFSTIAPSCLDGGRLGRRGYFPFAVRARTRQRIFTEKGKRMSSLTTPSGLIIEDLVVGDGAAATPGQYVTVHYTGWLTDGRKFDSSKDRNDPFEFPLGAGHVIRGWDEGVAGMKVGGTRKLTIPPQLGYGARGAGGVIPPNATLVFEVELLAVG